MKTSRKKSEFILSCTSNGVVINEKFDFKKYAHNPYESWILLPNTPEGKEIGKMIVTSLIEEREIKDSLEGLQQIVGGYIEIPFLSPVFNENEIDVVINEEGKFIEGLEPEIAIIKKEVNVILDIVYGNCIFASHDHEGNTTELNEEQLKIVAEELKHGVMLFNSNDNVKHFVRALIV